MRKSLREAMWALCGRGEYPDPLVAEYLRTGIVPDDDKSAGLIECAAAAILSALYADGRRRAGFKERDCKGPGPGRTRQHGWWDWHGGRPGWADHAWRRVSPDGEVVWVGEPYGLGVDDLRELVKLADEGWTVNVTGASMHFPGRTVKVEIRKPKAGK